MGHATIENATPWAVATSHAIDEDGRPLLVVFVQATYSIVGGRQLVLAATQKPPSLPGSHWGEDPLASYKIEPAFAFTKLATDVALVGHARAATPVTELTVSIRVGPVGKTLRVVGDRVWVRSGPHVVASGARPFFAMPLVYERAFGGWDRSDPDPTRHAYEPRNPVGVGFRASGAPFQEGVALPNIEDPADPVRAWGQPVAPAGVGFVSPAWQPRAALAGTSDPAKVAERAPLLPQGFDRRFFNAGSSGLVAQGHLRGDEPVQIDNASSSGRLAFRLPGVPPPRCRVALRGRADAERALPLDTVVLNTDDDEALLTYRTYVPLDRGPHDVLAVAVS